MKYSLAISAAVHVVFVAAVIVPAYQGRNIDSADVISVSLLGGGGGPAGGAPQAAAAQVEKEPEATKPSTSKMAYKPSKQDRKSKTSTTKSKSKTATAKASGSGASTGAGKSGAGSGKGTGSGPGGGGITVDSENFRFAYYLEVLRERIGYNWSPPPIFGAPSEVKATVYFKIARDGTVTEEKIEKSSSHEIFDRSALRAVKLADPLPPLPAGFKGKHLGVHFEFEHNPG